MACTPPPTPSQPDVRRFSSLSLSFTCSPHRRQRQKRVGMKTPNATSIGNIRLLLSAAYGLGVRGPDRTRFLGEVEVLFFSLSPTSPSSSSSSSSSLFSSPGCGCSFGTSTKHTKGCYLEKVKKQTTKTEGLDSIQDATQSIPGVPRTL